MIVDSIHVAAIAALATGAVCSAFILFDVISRPQRMKVMNVVWPVTALFGTVLTLWTYLHYARGSKPKALRNKAAVGNEESAGRKSPFPVVVAKGTLHCGAGCTIGDILAEWLAFLVPAVAVWFGWQALFADKMYAVWILDFLFAFALGLAFQYFAIVPMRSLSPAAGILAALKADTFSLLSWQIGMYGFMAFAQLYVFEHLLGHRAEVDTVEFWFAMQLAMVAGFVTAYPVNWWLIRSGVKEKM